MVYSRRSSGQALVLVLLTMAVVVTVVLYVVGRSVTDVSLSGSESQSVSAFSAAEAGVEQALVVGSGTGSDIVLNATNNTKYNASVTDMAKGSTSFVYPVELSSGDVMTLWLRTQDSSTPTNFNGSTLRVCWGKEMTYSPLSLQPAIEVAVYYETTLNNKATAKVFRAAYDPYTSARSAPNTFSAATTATCTIGVQNFPFYSTINLGAGGANLPLNNLHFATIRMFYNTDTTQPVGFDSLGSSQFPKQGILVESTGTSGQSTRKVEVFQSWPEVPSTFLSGIYSPTGLSK